MAQAVHTGGVTPADELRDLLTTAEKRLANVRGSGAGAVILLQQLDRIAALWPVLEAQGADLRPEAGRWATLQASIQRRTPVILAALQSSGGIDALRSQAHPQGTDASWWHLDATVTAERRKRLRRSAIIAAGALVVALAAFFILRSLTDPKVVEASRHVSTGEYAVQQAADWPAALAEFQAAAALTPADPDVWLRVGVAQEHLQDAAAARESYAKAHALLPSELEFLKGRAAAYLTFNLMAEAERDLQAALASKPDDAQAWYLAASVYETRGQNQQAIDALNQAAAYAEQAGLNELVALSRYRMGMLMQQVPMSQETVTP